VYANIRAESAEKDSAVVLQQKFVFTIVGVPMQGG